MIKKKVVWIFFIVLLLGSVCALESERYIVEIKGDINADLNKKVVEELHEPIVSSKQTAGTRIGIGGRKVIVNGTSEEELMKRNDVIYFEKDYRFNASASETWNYNAIGIDFNSIDENFGNGVKIAVLDTGADFDLLNVKSGWDFVNEDSDSSDDSGHGTLTTQILKMPKTDLPLRKTEIYAVKVLDESGGGWSSDVIEGINWAVENDIDIVLMSFGSVENSLFLEEAIEYAYEQNILFIAAAGNEYGENILFPAAYSEVVSAGSVDANLDKSVFSSYGVGLEFTAPGEGIFVTDGINNFFVDGTSFSVPHVGIATAGFLSDDLNLKNYEVRERLRENALDLGSLGWDGNFGYGLVKYKKINGSINLEEKVADLENRISVLEIWKETIAGTISNIWVSITGLVSSAEEYENRLEILEINSGGSADDGNLFPFYLNYFDSSDRKKIVCGYGEDKRLTHIVELGWDCDLSYKNYSSGKEKINCKCKKTD